MFELGGGGGTVFVSGGGGTALGGISLETGRLGAGTT